MQGFQILNLVASLCCGLAVVALLVVRKRATTPDPSPAVRELVPQETSALA